MATFKRKGARSSVLYEAIRNTADLAGPPEWAKGLNQWDTLPPGWWLVRFPEGFVAQLADDHFHEMFTEYVSAPNV